MILYIGNPKDSTQKLLELINKFSKIAGFKINIQKSVTFLCANNEILEKEYKYIIQFKIAPQKVKYLHIHLTKEVNDLYAENYKSLTKEIKEDVKKWKDSPCSWIGKINAVKMAIPPKAVYRFNAIPIKLLMTFFTEVEETIQKFFFNFIFPLYSKGVRLSLHVYITITFFPPPFLLLQHEYLDKVLNAIQQDLLVNI